MSFYYLYKTVEIKSLFFFFFYSQKLIWKMDLVPSIHCMCNQAAVVKPESSGKHQTTQILT
jgi:hypothetical protein